MEDTERERETDSYKGKELLFICSLSRFLQGPGQVGPKSEPELHVGLHVVSSGPSTCDFFHCFFEVEVLCREAGSKEGIPGLCQASGGTNSLTSSTKTCSSTSGPHFPEFRYAAKKFSPSVSVCTHISFTVVFEMSFCRI